MTRRETILLTGLLLAVLAGAAIRSHRKGWTPAAPSATLMNTPGAPSAAAAP